MLRHGKYFEPVSNNPIRFRHFSPNPFDPLYAVEGVELLAIGIQHLGIHGLGLVIVAIGKKLVVVLVVIVETVPASSTR
ncbi:hypothetical protein Tco_0881902 [Tanacetum coccineum]